MKRGSFAVRCKNNTMRPSLYLRPISHSSTNHATTNTVIRKRIFPMFFQALPASFSGLSGSLLMMLLPGLYSSLFEFSSILKAIPAPNFKECTIATTIPFEICFFIACPAGVFGAFSLKKRSVTITASDL